MNKKQILIGVTGGKGGTGKSTISTSLAYCLAKSQKVLLVDLDSECPNDHLILNTTLSRLSVVSQRIPNFDLSKCIKCGLCGEVCEANAIVSIKNKFPIFIKEQCNGCGSCVEVCPVDVFSWSKKTIGFVNKSFGKIKNLDVLSGELEINQPSGELIVDKAKAFIDKNKNDYDIIIIDTAAGTHGDVISALMLVDFVFVVTEPTPLGLHDLDLIVKVLKKLNKNYEIVLNKYDNDDKFLEKYNTKLFFKVPYSKEIVDSYSNALPLETKYLIEFCNQVKKYFLNNDD